MTLHPNHDLGPHSRAFFMGDQYPQCADGSWQLRRPATTARPKVFENSPRRLVSQAAILAFHQRLPVE